MHTEARIEDVCQALAENYAVMSAIFPMAAFEAYSERKKQRASKIDCEAKIETEIQRRKIH